MKTKEQVARNISRCKFSKKDWEATRIYLTEIYGRGINKPQQPVYHASFSWIQWWLTNGFASGDMVWVNGQACVVSYEVPEGVFFCAVESSKISTYDKNFPVAKHDDVRYMSDKDCKDFAYRINEQNLMLNVRSGLVFRKPAIVLNKLYKFKQYEVDYIGAFKEFVEDGQFGIFSFGFANNQLLGEFKVFKSDIGVALSLDEQHQFNETISALYGMEWDKKAGKFITKIPPVDRGHIYYYINDRLNVVSGHERNDLASTSRRNCLNYFSDYEIARKVSMQIKEMIEKMQLSSRTVASSNNKNQ